MSSDNLLYAVYCPNGDEIEDTLADEVNTGDKSAACLGESALADGYATSG